MSVKHCSLKVFFLNHSFNKLK